MFVDYYTVMDCRADRDLLDCRLPFVGEEDRVTYSNLAAARDEHKDRGSEGPASGLSVITAMHDKVFDCPYL